MTGGIGGMNAGVRPLPSMRQNPGAPPMRGMAPNGPGANPTMRQGPQANGQGIGAWLQTPQGQMLMKMLAGRLVGNGMPGAVAGL